MTCTCVLCIDITDVHTGTTVCQLRRGTCLFLLLLNIVFPYSSFRYLSSRIPRAPRDCIRSTQIFQPRTVSVVRAFGIFCHSPAGGASCYLCTTSLLPFALKRRCWWLVAPTGLELLSSGRQCIRCHSLDRKIDYGCFTQIDLKQ